MDLLCCSWMFLVSVFFFGCEILITRRAEKWDVSGTYTVAQLTEAFGERTACQNHNQLFPATKHTDA